MSDMSWEEQATKAARILQIIVGAMAAGASIFLAVVLTIGSQAKRLILPIPLAWIVALVVAVELIARAVVLGNIASKGRREIINGTYQPLVPRQRSRSLPPDIADKPPDPHRDAKYLLSVFQQQTIVSAALFEGCEFFATIAYLIEGNPISLGLAVLLALAVAANVPTQSRAIAWVERQMERLQEEKMVR